MSVTEGNAGAEVPSFTARVKGSGAAEASVAWATENVTATAGNDYNSGNGTVVFSSGKSQRINITVLGDQSDEPNETFNVNLSGAVNATRGIITGDEAAPRVSVANATAREGSELAVRPGRQAVTNSDLLTRSWKHVECDQGTVHLERIGTSSVRHYDCT
jgi:hypothetical protein